MIEEKQLQEVCTKLRNEFTEDFAQFRGDVCKEIENRISRYDEVSKAVIISNVLVSLLSFELATTLVAFEKECIERILKEFVNLTLDTVPLIKKNYEEFMRKELGINENYN